MGSKWKFPNIATLFLNRKLEAEDATCDRLSEEVLGHTHSSSQLQVEPLHADWYYWTNGILPQYTATLTQDWQSTELAKGEVF